MRLFMHGIVPKAKYICIRFIVEPSAQHYTGIVPGSSMSTLDIEKMAEAAQLLWGLLIFLPSALQIAALRIM